MLGNLCRQSNYRGLAGVSAALNSEEEGSHLPRTEYTRKLNHARLLIKSERYSEALEKLKELVLLDPRTVNPWKWMGIVLERLGRMNEAMDAYQRGEDLACAARKRQVRNG